MLHQLVQVLNLGTGTSKYITGRGTSTWLPSIYQFPYKFRFATRGAVRPRVASPAARRRRGAQHGAQWPPHALTADPNAWHTCTKFSTLKYYKIVQYLVTHCFFHPGVLLVPPSIKEYQNSE